MKTAEEILRERKLIQTDGWVSDESILVSAAMEEYADQFKINFTEEEAAKLNKILEEASDYINYPPILQNHNLTQVCRMIIEKCNFLLLKFNK